MSQPAIEAKPKRIRHVRMGDELWVAACRKANENGMSISELVRNLLRNYLDEA